MSSPVCHRANGRVYSHIPRKKHPPLRVQKWWHWLHQVRLPKISFTHLSFQPAFLWKQAKPPTNEPTCSTLARASSPKSFQLHRNRGQTITGLSASSGTGRMQGKAHSSLENWHTTQLFLWLGHSVKAWNYLVIKESNHEKAIRRKPSFITSTADDTTLKTGRKKRKNIGTPSDGASNVYLEIYCPE